MDACFKDKRCAGKVLWISDRNKSVAEIPRQRVRELRSSGLMPLDAYPPPPSIYWNHRDGDKTRIELLTSITYGQNIEPQGLTRATLASRSPHALDHDYAVLWWGQGQMSQSGCGEAAPAFFFRTSAFPASGVSVLRP